MKLNLNVKKLKELKGKTTALALATTMTLASSGCGKKNEEIGFNVTDDLESRSGLYTYVINKKGLESEKYDFQNSHSPISFGKVTDEKEYGTNVFNEQSTAFYRDAVKMVIPDYYKGYGIAWYTTRNFDFDIITEQIDAGNEFVVVYSSMTAKRDLRKYEGVIPGYIKEYKKGDNMSSISIYCDNELVAYKQIGVGSECENVKNSTIGDVSLALSKVSDVEALEETKDISFEELDKYENQLNKEQHAKVLKLQY